MWKNEEVVFLRKRKNDEMKYNLIYFEKLSFCLTKDRINNLVSVKIYSFENYFGRNFLLALIGGGLNFFQLKYNIN